MGSLGKLLSACCFRLSEARHEITVEGNISRVEMPQPVPHQLMKSWQRMERHRRKAVMFGVEGHIPGQPADRRQCQQGAGIGQHVAGALVASGMLGQKIGAQEWLADKKWQDKACPQPALLGQQRQDHGMPGQHPPRLADDRGAAL